MTSKTMPPDATVVSSVELHDSVIGFAALRDELLDPRSLSKSFLEADELVGVSFEPAAERRQLNPPPAEACRTGRGNGMRSSAAARRYPFGSCTRSFRQ